MGSDYFIGVHDAELARLRDQHAAWLPQTQALWARAGFRDAQHIADLGSGPGFTTIDLARRVLPSGRVSAVDKAPIYLDRVAEQARRLKLDNVATLAADVTRDAIGDAVFDGAFCRFFLAFLIADLDRALDNIRRSLEPSGTFAMMEYLTLASAAVSPPLAGFDAHTRAWIDYYLAHGGDTAVGAILPAKLEAAGFCVRSIECVGGMARAGTPLWHWWGRLMSDFGATLVSGRFMREAERAALEADWARASRDANAFIHTPILVQIVAAAA
jgi:SAM-dependent methyltransferase